MATESHDSKSLRLAIGSARSLSRVKNETLSWGELRQLLSRVARSEESFDAYRQLSAEKKNELKAGKGWLVGGHCECGRRKGDAIKERAVLTFDLDDANDDQIMALQLGTCPISVYEFFWHTTRSHSPDAPRLRIYVPLEQPVAADQYAAVARIFAHKLDPSMDTIDPVSFRVSQLMYLPTASQDSDFIAEHNRGKLLSAQELLESWPGWADHTKLPHSERRGIPRPSSKKAENPREKGGVIGAFCRVFDVEEAIAEFLPDIYVPGDTHSKKPRYTYAPGSTANGVVVEDGGLFIYSHHATDPCFDRLCNAWDMVRIHKFGDLDDDATDEMSPGRLRSFKEMQKLALEDERVRNEYLEDEYSLVDMFDDADEDECERGAADVDDVDDLLGLPGGRVAEERFPSKPAPPPKAWRSQLQLDQNGKLLPNFHNLKTILRNDQRLFGLIAFNEFTGKLVIRRKLKSIGASIPALACKDEVNGDPWTDLHDTVIRAILESPRRLAGWNVKASARNLADAIRLVGDQHRFHPVKEYFAPLEWDGEPRVERIFVDYLGCPDEPYFRETVKLVLMAAVARIYCPGHKFDYAPILSGPQGIRKSTFIKALFGEEWTGELSVNMTDHKAAVEQMHGKLCLELPELSSMKRAETEDVKHFMTIQCDRVRLAYDRRISEFPRQMVFMGTTNSAEYLKDTTGNRRWWPIPVSVDQINTERLKAERDQIWAEAVEMYWDLRETHPAGGLPLYLSDPNSIGKALILQESFREESHEESVAAIISNWLEAPTRRSVWVGEGKPPLFSNDDEPFVLPVVVCLERVFCEALGGDKSHYASNKSIAPSIGKAMSHVPGWRKFEHQKRLPKYGKQRVWVRKDATQQELAQGYRIVDDSPDSDHDLSDLL